MNATGVDGSLDSNMLAKLLFWLTPIGSIISKIASPFTKIVSNYFSYRNLKAAKEAELIGRVIEADIENRIIRKERLSEDMEWAPFRWLRFFVFLSIMSYYVAIIADSIFHFPADIAQLPSSVKNLIDQWGGWIVAYFTLMGGQSILSIITRWLFRK